MLSSLQTRREYRWHKQRLVSLPLDGELHSPEANEASLAWVLHKDYVCAPIVGISRLDRFDDVLGALDVELTEDEIKFLEEPYQP